MRQTRHTVRDPAGAIPILRCLTSPLLCVRHRRLPVGRCLYSVQFGVQAVGGDEAGVVLSFCDAAVFDDDDVIGHAYRGEAVRDEDRDRAGCRADAPGLLGHAAVARPGRAAVARPGRDHRDCAAAVSGTAAAAPARAGAPMTVRFRGRTSCRAAVVLGPRAALRSAAPCHRRSGLSRRRPRLRAQHRRLASRPAGGADVTHHGLRVRVIYHLVSQWTWP